MPIAAPVAAGITAATSLAGTGMQIAGAAMGGGQPQQQPGQVPQPEGNPMQQNPMGGAGGQQQMLPMSPLGGLPGGGGWI